MFRIHQIFVLNVIFKLKMVQISKQSNYLHSKVELKPFLENISI